MPNAGTYLIVQSTVCTVRTLIGQMFHRIHFVVLPVCTHEVILGFDFICSTSPVIDRSTSELHRDENLISNDISSPNKKS